MRGAWIGLAILAILAVLLLLPLPVHSQVPSMTFSWTAPGDDDNVGQATRYEMRWATTRPDTTSASAKNSWWASGTIVTGLPSPSVAGATDSVTVSPPGGFTSGRTFYFVLRAVDDSGNMADFSNVWAEAVADVQPPRAIINLRRIR